MELKLTGQAAAEALARASALGLEPAEYLARLVRAEAADENRIDDLLADSALEADTPWDIEAIRAEGQAIARKLRGQ